MELAQEKRVEEMLSMVLNDGLGDQEKEELYDQLKEIFFTGGFDD